MQKLSALYEKYPLKEHQYSADSKEKKIDCEVTHLKIAYDLKKENVKAQLFYAYKQKTQAPQLL